MSIHAPPTGRPARSFLAPLRGAWAALALGALACRHEEVVTESPPRESQVHSEETAAPEQTGCLAVSPAVGDPDGGGVAITVTVEGAEGVVEVTLGGEPLTALSLVDSGSLSGVPGPHAAGTFDVVVRYASGREATCEGAFAYWSPALIEGAVVFDAGKSVTDAGDGAVGAWTDQGPAGRVLSQSDPALRPLWVPGAFGSLPAIRFSGGQHLALPAPVDLSAEGTSVFAVARWTATTDALPPPGNAGNVPLTLVGDGVGAYGAFGAAGDRVISNHYVGGPVYVQGGSGLNDGRVRLIGATYDTATEAKIYVGANQQGLDDYSAPIIGANSWDRVGAGYGGDGWEGDVGAVVIASGVIGPEDRVRLDAWAQQRFGTPASLPLDPWVREKVGEMPEGWHPRDGAQIVRLTSGRLLFIGGWSPYDPWGGDRQTNEVWASDDDGRTWALLLAHDPHPPEDGAGARFRPGHTVGVTTWQGHAVVIGSDCNTPPYLGDVWIESDEGATWTRVSTDAPTAGRCLFMVGSLGDDLYVMGGQSSMYDEGTAISDAWRSEDGGQTWTRLEDPPWSGRGMVYRPVEHDGRLWIVGGGRYDESDVVAFNGVWSFDGAAWEEVLPDGHERWEAAYYVGFAALRGRLWLLGGFTGTEELQRALTSDDGGRTWVEQDGGAGGRASHADAVVALPDQVLRVSGNLNERGIWTFHAP